MLLITIFVELRVVAGRSRTRADSHRPSLVLCRILEKNCMVRAGHGHGIASVNQTRPHCVNQSWKRGHRERVRASVKKFFGPSPFLTPARADRPGGKSTQTKQRDGRWPQVPSARQITT